MGKKGSKRKTRWRTISIGAPPGEEDEEEGLRNGCPKLQNEAGYERNGQAGYKPRWANAGGYTGGGSGTGSGSGSGSGSASGTGIGTGNGTGVVGRSGGPGSGSSSGYGSGGQQKIAFNEDEYLKITTPRQDILFKKGYLSRKKPWSASAGNASTSATPSTTESQSASHSTADGSETTEDQQLLDRDPGLAEYPGMVEPGPQLSYGTFYDQTTGYYYEYPVMLVGPAPVPNAAQMGPSVLATLPCGPVPLRPIEWMNPAFAPKMGAQPYCVMDYQMSQPGDGVALVEEQDATLLSVENSDETCNESGTGSGSCNGSMACEDQADNKSKKSEEEQQEQRDQETQDQQDEQNQEDQLEVGLEPQEQSQSNLQQQEQQMEEQQPVENGGLNRAPPFLEPMLMQPPVHNVPHMIPAVPQPYMYPGHYMFGPPLINVNGVTMQSGPMIRTTDAAAMAAAFAKRRKKKKRRKQRRAAVGNTEEEEAEYSSECDNGVPSSLAAWTATTTTTTTTVNRPLNPECQEFQLRTALAPSTSPLALPNSDQEPRVGRPDGRPCNGLPLAAQEELPNGQSPLDGKSMADETSESSVKRLRDCSEGREVAPKGQDDAGTEEETSPRAEEKEPSANCSRNHQEVIAGSPLENFEEVPEEASRTSNGHTEPSELANETVQPGPGRCTSACTEMATPTDIIETNGNEVDQRVRGESGERNDRERSRSVPPEAVPRAEEEPEEPRKRKPQSELVSKSQLELESKLECSLDLKPEPGLNGVLEDGARLVSMCNTNSDLESVDLELSNSSCGAGPKVESESNHVGSKASNSLVDVKGSRDEIVERASNEDSGFESQTRGSDYPITKVVTEWLNRVNSPDMFILSAGSGDSGTEEDEELELELKLQLKSQEPPKNLQGNPMPALSANSEAGRAASCGEFARLEPEPGPRRRRDGKGQAKRKPRMSDSCGHQEVSSSDSCGQQDEGGTSDSARRNRQSRQGAAEEACEFTDMDSVAGMRVASSSRMDAKRVSGVRRTKKVGRPSRDPESLEGRTRRPDKDGGIVEDTVPVRTYEKGEIVVSEDGKFLATSSQQQRSNLDNNNEVAERPRPSVQLDQIREERVQDPSPRMEESQGSQDQVMVASLESIEEPDVLECWEAETVEPVVTPRKLLQSRGILCEGEAAEEDAYETAEHVQKYYRLARESASLIEDGSLHGGTLSSRTVPNSPDRMIESFCSEEVPVMFEVHEIRPVDEKEVPIDEAFEVYVSCYNGKPEVLGDNMFKRTLYGQEEERPIPCKAVCCSIQ